MMANLQNGRILRFMIAIGAVVLTIFVYASYYSNSSIGISTHLRMSPAQISSSSSISSEKYLFNNLSVFNEDIGITNSVLSKNNFAVEENINIIDGNLNNLNDELEYSHVKNANINTNSKNNTTDQAQKIMEGDYNFYINASLGAQDAEKILIPTSNIQTIVSKADKILKNMSSSSSTYSNLQPSREELQDHLPKNKRAKSNSKVITGESSLAQPPSVLIPNKHMKSFSGSVDPTQGIPTKDIYEYGHLEFNPLICPDKGEFIKLLIIITSAYSHQEARLAIRQTWGHYGTRRDVGIVFILGRKKNKTLENALKEENFIYGDLIIGHFIDSYNNLTLKTISALEWVDQNCPKAKFVLKTDDDMFINVPKLMSFLDKHKKDKRVIFGRLAKKWKPIRNKKSKYYVSSGQFSAIIFPPFTTGPAYVMSADVIHELYVRALQQTYLKLEDVFTTGIVAQQLGIKRIHVNEFLNRRIAFNPCNIRKTISVHMIKSNEQFDLWKKLLDQSTNCK